MNTKGNTDRLKQAADKLNKLLPAWSIMPYGRNMQLACYPPGGVSMDAWNELAQYATIFATAGPLYIVNLTKYHTLYPEIMFKHHAHRYAKGGAYDMIAQAHTGKLCVGTHDPTGKTVKGLCRSILGTPAGNHGTWLICIESGGAVYPCDMESVNLCA